MLQVTDPKASQASGTSSQIGDARQIRVESHRGVIDSSAMTKEAFAPELEDEYRLAPTPIPEEAMDGLASLIAPPKVDEEPLFQEPLSAPPMATPLLQKPVGGAGTLPVDPNHIQLLAVRRTARRRQLLMVAVLGSSGVLLAGILFAGFLYWYTAEPSSTIAKNASNADLGVNEPKHVGPKREAEQDVLDDPLSAPPADPLADPLNDPLADATSSDQAATKPSEGTTEPPDEPKSISNAILNATSEADAKQPNNPLSTETRSNPVIPSEAETNADEQVAAPNTVDATELPEQLKKFQSILNTTIEPQFLEDQAIQKAPPTAKELGLSSGQGSKALPPVDVDKQMQLAITGLIIPPGSVSNAVSQWVQVSGVPTVVDLDSFVAAGVDPNRSIGQIRVGAETPLEQVAVSIAKEIGVDSKVFENQFLAFQASEGAIRDRMPTSIKINDLVENEEQQQWLLKVLDKVWPEYEGKWIVRDGELTVDPNVIDPLAWFWAVRMLESWRMAASIETQLDKAKLDQSKFVTKFVDPDAIPALNKPLTLKLVNRAPVAQWVAELSAASKVDVWVDWASVGQKGLGPNSIDFIVTKDRKLRECLRDLAEKYSLVIACENDKSIVITTMEIYRVQPRLYVLPSQGKTAEQWMEELQPLTPATATAAQPIQAYLTPGGDFVIVRCCRPRLRN